MKTIHALCLGRRTTASTAALLLVSLVLIPPSLFGQNRKKNPTSKLFVSDLSGEAQIDTGDNIQDLTKRSVYTAQGTIIETGKAEKPADVGKIFSTMVYSNGTGAYFDQDTKVEVRRFVQEPFTPNRTDMDVEPSISQTQAYVSRGVVGLCTSKLVAGSTMNYSTPQGSINIRGKKVVIEADNNETKVSMLDGDSTIRGGDSDMGGHLLRAGEQAIIRRGRGGQPNAVTIQPIPPAEATVLDDKVAMACIAKKTVYFEVKERVIEGGADSKADASTGNADSTASGGSTTDATSTGASGAVTAFDGPVANSGFASSPVRTTVQEIVVVPVVPVNLPVEFTVSPARILTPSPGG